MATFRNMVALTSFVATVFFLGSIGGSVAQECDASGGTSVAPTTVDVGYGVPQLLPVGFEDMTQAQIDKMVRYMSDHEDKTEECENRSEHCSYWAAAGNCEGEFAPYMQINCNAACLNCEPVPFEQRCPMPEVLNDAWKPGDMYRMFERIITDEAFQKYNPTALSRPTDEEMDDKPWVVQVDGLLTADECNKLIEAGNEQGFDRSMGAGGVRSDGTLVDVETTGRTSASSWCMQDCYKLPVAKAVQKKLDELTGMPEENAEYIQLLKYDEGEFYSIHHDYIDHHIERAQGARILTVLLYLNDVEEGGATAFPHLDLKITPKQGRAVIWPSVFNDRPNEKDGRTHHEALPVTKGTKYAANGWYHQRDFKTPHSAFCI